jgi:hypothetical protein
MLRAKFFERLPGQNGFTFNRMHTLAKHIVKKPAYTYMRKQELLFLKEVAENIGERYQLTGEFQRKPVDCFLNPGSSGICVRGLEK